MQKFRDVIDRKFVRIAGMKIICEFIAVDANDRLALAFIPDREKHWMRRVTCVECRIGHCSGHEARDRDRCDSPRENSTRSSPGSRQSIANNASNSSLVTLSRSRSSLAPFFLLFTTQIFRNVSNDKCRLRTFESARARAIFYSRAINSK